MRATFKFSSMIAFALIAVLAINAPSTFALENGKPQPPVAPPVPVSPPPVYFPPPVAPLGPPPQAPFVAPSGCNMHVLTGCTTRNATGNTGYGMCSFDTFGYNYCLTGQTGGTCVTAAQVVGVDPSLYWYSIPITTGECPKHDIPCASTDYCLDATDNSTECYIVPQPPSGSYWGCVVPGAKKRDMEIFSAASLNTPVLIVGALVIALVALFF